MYWIMKKLGYIHEEDLRKYISESNNKAVKEVRESFKREKEEFREELIKEYEFIIADKEREIRFQKDEIDKLTERLGDTQQDRRDILKNSRMNTRISSDLKSNIAHLLEVVGDLYAVLSRTNDNAIDQEKEIKKISGQIQKRVEST